jgi:hypothetical protein
VVNREVEVVVEQRKRVEKEVEEAAAFYQSVVG